MEIVLYIVLGSVMATVLILLGWYLAVTLAVSTYNKITYAEAPITNPVEENTTTTQPDEPYNWNDYDEYITGEKELEDVPEA